MKSSTRIPATGAADADPMDSLRTAVSALALHDKDKRDLSRANSIKVATRLTGQFPTIVAAIDRARNGKSWVHPEPKLNIATNFLYMLTGKEPGALESRIFDVALILHAEHEMNASTFSAMVTASTLSDMYSSIASISS